ncbi:MAG: hypothetical protein C0404_09900 [Verrucomicrobia bacterium]|nr:hypothetical protein [Verrucomicrobiota bacterium]
MPGAPEVPQRTAIVGLGLMGASLGLAIKRRHPSCVVSGYARRAETRREALKRRIVDEVYDSPEAAVAGADIVVICLPVLMIPRFIRACRNHFAPSAVVTDVGSTKEAVTSDAERALRGTSACFVGSHPIAGSDETGLASARADLYKGAIVVVTPAGKARTESSTRRIAAFWRSLGATVCIMTPRRHDSVVARTSHLPHLAAAGLAATVLRKRDGESCMLCGSGFRDSTRIAGGSADIWHDIIKTNQASLRKELGEFQKTMSKLDSMLAKGNFRGLRKFLSDTREKRLGMAYRQRRNGGR